MWTVRSYDRRGAKRSAVFSCREEAWEYVSGLMSRGFSDDGWGWLREGNEFTMLLSFHGYFPEGVRA